MEKRNRTFRQTRAGYIPEITANALRDLAFHTRYAQWVILAVAVEQLDDRYQGDIAGLVKAAEEWLK
jgi:hypothetical protein